MRVSWLVAACCLFSPAFAHAMALRVSPVLLNVIAPGNVTQLTLRNDQPRPLAVQLRIFRWTQRGGEDRLEPTADVVVSPPMITLQADQDYVVRVVRVGAQPVVGEESYRLVVDEIPDLTRRLNGSVVLALRQSIPVFFTSPDAKPPSLSWSWRYENGFHVVSARNDGDRRIRISNAVMRGARGAVLTRREGLVGYALGGSEVKWKIPAGRAEAALSLDADSESGPVHAVLSGRVR